VNGYLESGLQHSPQAVDQGRHITPSTKDRPEGRLEVKGPISKPALDGRTRAQ
jgi:hypothetical protein